MQIAFMREKGKQQAALCYQGFRWTNVHFF